MLIGLAVWSYRMFNPGDRHLYLNFDSGHGHGYLYYEDGLWTRYLPLERQYEVTLYYADLSPDGSKIAFKKDSFLYIHNLHSNALVRLNAEPNYPSDNTSVQWSLDGSRIGFACSLTYEAPIEVCSWDVIKGEMQILSDLQAYGKYDALYFGGWSADAKTIAFIILYPEDRSGNRLQRILRLDTDTGTVSTVLDSQQAGLDVDRNIALSPDGRTILFSANTLLEEQAKDYLYALYQINSDGSGLRRLVDLDRWSLFLPVWSPDGRSFYVNAAGDYGLIPHGYFHMIPRRYDLSGRLTSIPISQLGRIMLSWRSAE